MAVTSHQIDVDSFLEITKTDIIRQIGYASEAALAPRISSLIDEYNGKARSLIEPAYSYTILDINRTEPPFIFIGNSIVFESPIISRVMERCISVAIFALTIGGRLEEMCARLGNDGAITEAYILEVIGSEIAEKSADFVHGLIGELANIRGLAVSRRFSPGHCDWDISQQKIIFEALEGETGGVKLSHDYLMIPKKSLSGIIGIGLRDSGVASYNPCKTCPDTTCPWRRD